MDPTDSLNIEMYVDANFAGMHGYKHPENPMSVWSRAGYVITIAKCSVLWVGRLQPGTAMSTMMAGICRTLNGNAGPNTLERTDQRGRYTHGIGHQEKQKKLSMKTTMEL